MTRRIQITLQLKLIAGAAFSVLLLRRRLRALHWLSLALLLVGVTVVQLEQQQQQQSNTSGGGGSSGNWTESSQRLQQQKKPIITRQPLQQKNPALGLSKHFRILIYCINFTIFEF